RSSRMTVRSRWSSAGSIPFPGLICSGNLQARGEFFMEAATRHSSANPTATDPAAELPAAWLARLPHLFDGWAAAAPPGLPMPWAEPAGLLRSVPASSILIRRGAASPGAGMESLPGLPACSLEELFCDGGPHVMVLNLQDHSPAYRQLLQSFL